MSETVDQNISVEQEKSRWTNRHIETDNRSSK